MMADYQRTVDEIMQVVLNPQAGTPPSAFAALAKQYAEAVREVNDRLRECDRLLRRGHRAEAIRQAEDEPNLLDSVAILDFSERQLWAGLTTHNGLPGPPELLIDIAADVNEAYSAEQKLSRLMRYHRLHALARSPLRARIDVMRKIAELDRDSPVWESDIREFEKVRIGQLAEEVELAGKSRDPVALASLEEELSSPEWREQPPRRLVERTARLHTQLRATQARGELVKLQEQLNEAFSDLDVEQGRKVRLQWNARSAIANLKPDDQLLELVGPALEWLAKQDQEDHDRAEYESALTGLDRALDRGASRGELERLAHAVARHELEMPDMLGRRLKERIRYLDLAAVRRGRMILVCVILLALLVAGAVTFGIIYHLHSQQVASHEANLKQLFQDGKLTEARDYLNELEQNDPGVFASPAIQQLQADVQAATTEEEERKGRFTQLLEGARDAGVENPTWASLPVATKKLDDAEALAASDSERVEVRKLRFQVQQSKLTMQQDVDDEFRRELDKLKEGFQKVEAAPELQAVDQLIKDGRSLQQREYVSSLLMSNVEPLIERLGAMQDAMLEDLDEVGFLERITQTVGDEDAFQSELERYAKRFPGRSRAADFERVAKREIVLWKGIGRWDQLIGGRLQRDLTRLRPEDAQALATEIENLQEEYKFLPAPEGLEPVQLFLDAITKRVDEGGNRIHLRLNDVDGLNNPTVVDVSMVEVRGGKKYYFQRDPIDIGSDLSFYHVTGFDLEDTERLKLPKTQVMNRPLRNGYDWTAPQATFSRYALDRLARLNDGNWVSTFSDVLLRLHGDEEIEPVLKVQLMQLLLTVAREGSYCLHKALEAQAEILESARLDPGANWLDPDDPDGQKARATAQQVAARLGDLDAALSEAGQLLESFTQPAFEVRGSQWVGWLMRAPGREWTCAAQEGVLQKLSGDVVVLHVGSEDTPAAFSKIGVVRGGRLQVGSQSDPKLVEGRAVFRAEPLSP